MNILGIHDGHNAAACLLSDGNVLMALQEERLRRVKNYAGFPSLAIQFILDECGMAIGDIDVFALVGRNMPDQNTKESRLELYREVGQRGYLERERKATRRKAMLEVALPPQLRRSLRSMLGIGSNGGRVKGRLAQAIAFGIPEARIRIVEHHLAHAAAAYYGYGVYDRDILVLTNDGEGDGICASVSIGHAGRLDRLGSVPRSESIGNLYAVITFMMGMVPLEHEYKLMGMAPYADEQRADAVRRKLRSLFAFDGAVPYGWRRSNGCPDLFYSYNYLRELLELDRFDSICAGLQRFTEEMLLQWVKNCIAATGVPRLALGGGVFMNVKLNKAIMELPVVEDLFVFPSCADETNVLGAAYWIASQEEGHDRIRPLRDLYFGKSYRDTEVRAAIDGFQFSRAVDCRRLQDIEVAVAELIAGGAVVARFKGREEFGARALGNRSILADPANTEVIKIINSMIKCRDFWMPFATSMTDRQAAACLINPKQIPAPYMIMTFDSAEQRIGDFKAGAHPYDRTVRPQVVYREWNESYYRLIEEFERRSKKRGGVLNTSFNLHGHPLVSSPQDALEVFDRSGLQYLAIENHLLRKGD
jgi:carbamoyltransferase